MADLFLHGRKLDSIFELLGTKEDDITYSIGWALAQSPGFLRALLSRIFGRVVGPGEASVSLQQHGDKDDGFTDIEVKAPDLHVIVEAKRGWSLPGDWQLNRYVPRQGPQCVLPMALL